MRVVIKASKLTVLGLIVLNTVSFGSLIGCNVEGQSENEGLIETGNTDTYLYPDVDEEVVT